jgi:hypothetical protein
MDLIVVYIPGTCLTSYEFDCMAWAGGNDVDLEGSYRWQHSNLMMNFTNWRSGEPSGMSQGIEEDCLMIMRNGLWNDGYCDYKAAFICEIANP